MKRREIVLATTHVDAHSSKMTKESLEDAAKSLEGRYIPLLNEHDWLQPLGRIASGAVCQRPDGEWELTGVAEVLERADDDVPIDQTREFRVSVPDGQGLSVRVGDEFIRDPNSRSTVREFKALLKKPVGFEARRALEPADLVKISLVVTAVGAAFHGFFSELGADGYRALKAAACRSRWSACSG